MNNFLLSSFFSSLSSSFFILHHSSSFYFLHRSSSFFFLHHSSFRSSFFFSFLRTGGQFSNHALPFLFFYLLQERYGGVLACQAHVEDGVLNVESVWGHSTESMAIGYFASGQKMPKVHFYSLSFLFSFTCILLIFIVIHFLYLI